MTEGIGSKERRNCELCGKSFRFETCENINLVSPPPDLQHREESPVIAAEQNSD